MHKGIYQHYKDNYYEVIDIARHSETLENIAEIAAMKLSHIDKPFPGGESLLNVITRITNFIQLLPKGQILIIGHGAIYYALEYMFNNIPLETLLTTSWQWQPGWIYPRLDKP